MAIATRLTSIALAASSIVLVVPAASPAAAATTSRAAAATASASTCYRISINIAQGSFNGHECHYSWGVSVTGTLSRVSHISQCTVIEVDFVPNGYRWAKQCGGGSKNVSWSQGGAYEAKEYLSYGI